MSIPGFTAEASIGPTTQVYRVHDRYAMAITSGMHPQLNNGYPDSASEQGFDEDMAQETPEEVADIDSVEGVADEGAMDMAEHVSVAEHDEVHIEA